MDELCSGLNIARKIAELLKKAKGYVYIMQFLLFDIKTVYDGKETVHVNLIDLLKQKKEEGIEDIPISNIRINPDNPRKNFDTSAIEDLAHTIEEHGLLQPILVFKENESYRVLSGERRLRAVRHLKMDSIPCTVKKP